MSGEEFYSLIVAANKRYIKLEDHEYIKHFVQNPCSPDYFNPDCIVQYCKYVVNNNYYAIGMFSYFANKLNSDQQHICTRIIIKSCREDIVLEYITTFRNIIVNINPYCKNKNITKLIIQNFVHIIDTFSFCYDIVKNNSIEEYNLYTHLIKQFMNTKLYSWYTNSTEMFYKVYYDFPNSLSNIIVPQIIRLGNIDIVNILIENNIINEKFVGYMDEWCRLYPNLRPMLNKFLMNLDGEKLFSYVTFSNDILSVIEEVFIHKVNLISVNELKQLFSTFKFNTCCVYFRDLIDKFNINSINAEIIKLAIDESINECDNYIFFHTIDFSNKNIKTCLNMFRERTRSFTTTDWIEFINNLVVNSYSIWTDYNIYQYYKKYASVDVRKIIEWIFNKLRMDSIFYIIASNDMHDNYALNKIMKKRLKEIEKLTICYNDKKRMALKALEIFFSK
jgi:hypothetical protein